MAEFTPKRRSLTAPKMNSGSNAMERLIYAQSKGMMDAQMKSKQRGNISEDIDVIKGEFGGNIPVGTTYTPGDVAVPLNPKLDNEQSRAVAANEVYPGIKQEVLGLIKGGTLGSQKGFLGMGKKVLPDVDRTVRQMSAQSKSPLATYYDPKLQMLQSRLANLKQIMFERSGATLTTNEESVLGNAFKLEGKSDDQIIADIESADALVEAKARLILGGANAARSPIPGMRNSVGVQNQQGQNLSGQGNASRLQAIKDRFKQRNP